MQNPITLRVLIFWDTLHVLRAPLEACLFRFVMVRHVEIEAAIGFNSS